MQQTPTFWSIKNFEQRLHDVCKQFHLSFDALQTLLETRNTYLAGGAALYCATGATQRKDGSYSGDLDFYIHYNSETIFDVIAQISSLLLENNYLVNHERSFERPLPVNCESCHARDIALFRSVPCNHFICMECVKNATKNAQATAVCKTKCPVQGCNTLSDTIPYDFRKVGINQRDLRENNHVLYAFNGNFHIYEQQLKSVKFFMEFSHREFHEQKIQLIFVCNPIKLMKETFDLTCCCIYITYNHEAKQLVCFSIHKLLLKKNIAIWTKEATTLSEHEIERISKYIEKGFKIYVKNQAIADHYNSFQTKRMGYLYESLCEGISKEVMKYVVAPFVATNVKFSTDVYGENECKWTTSQYEEEKEEARWRV